MAIFNSSKNTGMAKNEPVTTSSTYNVLAAGTTIKGNIIAEEDFRVDGTIDGNIACKGKIIVGIQSNITGEIDCLNIDVLGKMSGNIVCSSKVVLRSTANLTGEIKTKEIEIEPGALFFGTCTMITDQQQSYYSSVDTDAE